MVCDLPGGGAAPKMSEKAASRWESGYPPRGRWGAARGSY
jgi:hypothetical protein